MSAPEMTSWAAVPPLFETFQRCAVLSGQNKSLPAPPVGAPISGKNKEPPAQESRSLLSFDQQMFALFAALRQHGPESLEAKRNMPVVAGLAELEVKGLVAEPLEAPKLPGT